MLLVDIYIRKMDELAEKALKAGEYRFCFRDYHISAYDWIAMRDSERERVADEILTREAKLWETTYY